MSIFEDKPKKKCQCDDSECNSECNNTVHDAFEQKRKALNRLLQKPQR